VQILNKGLLNVSRFKVWDSLVVFSAVAHSREMRMNETDQKIRERPERDPSDGSGRNHASDFEDDLDAFADRTDRYEEGKDD
jgi:hypothetical protein